MAQLVERSFPKAEVCSSNPVIGEILFIINCIEKKKIKKKEAGNGPFTTTMTRHFPLKVMPVYDCRSFRADFFLRRAPRDIEQPWRVLPKASAEFVLSSAIVAFESAVVGTFYIWKRWYRVLLVSLHPYLQAVWPDWAIYWTLGNFLKPLATINLPKYPHILRQFL